MLKHAIAGQFEVAETFRQGIYRFCHNTWFSYRTCKQLSPFCRSQLEVESTQASSILQHHLLWESIPSEWESLLMLDRHTIAVRL